MPPASVPWRSLFVPALIGPLVIVCLGVMLHAMDGLMVATMLPDIVQEIGGLGLISWVVMLYEVGSIVAGAACGLLVSRHGLRRPMALAALVFAAGCALSALAQTMPVLLWGRLFQGLGGGGLMAMSFVAAGLMFAPHLQARVVGLVSTIWAAAAFSGPLVGGLFLAVASWQAAFWFFAAGGVGLSLLIIWLNPVAGGDNIQAGRFPIRRLAVLLMGVMAVAAAGEEISPLRTPALLVLGGALIILFIQMDKHSSADRLLPPVDFRLRDPITAGLATILLFAMATIAIGTYGPYFLTQIFGLSPLTAGALIAVEAIGWAGMAALISGRDAARDAQSIRTGFMLVTLGVIALALCLATGPVWAITLAGLIQGAGFGMAWAFVLRKMTGIAAAKDTALISASIPTVQRLGYAIGAAILGVCANLSGIEDGETLRAAWVVFGFGVLPACAGLWTMNRFLRSRT